MGRNSIIGFALIASLLVGSPGLSAFGFSGDQSPNVVLSNGLVRPSGIAFDSSGNLWVSDSGASRVYEFTPPFTSGSSPAMTLSNGLEGPAGIAFSSGNLWVADYGAHRVLEYAQPITGSSVPAVTLSNAGDPIGVAFDPAGDLWVANFGEFQEANSSDPNIPVQTIIPGSVFQFVPPFSSEEPPKINMTNGIVSPLALAFTSGNLLVADQGARAVLVFSAPLSNSSPPSTVLSNSITDPAGIALDSSGDMWVADYGSASIVEFAAPLRAESPVVALSKGLSDSTAIAFDQAGNLWVADIVGGKVVEFANPNPPSAGNPLSLYLLAVPVFLAAVIAGYFVVRRKVRGNGDLGSSRPDLNCMLST